MRRTSTGAPGRCFFNGFCPGTGIRDGFVEENEDVRRRIKTADSFSSSAVVVVPLLKDDVRLLLGGAGILLAGGAAAAFSSPRTPACCCWETRYTRCFAFLLKKLSSAAETSARDSSGTGREAAATICSRVAFRRSRSVSSLRTEETELDMMIHEEI